MFSPLAVRSGRASYEELNERHLAFHVSLVALTGSGIENLSGTAKEMRRID